MREPTKSQVCRCKNPAFTNRITGPTAQMATPPPVSSGTRGGSDLIDLLLATAVQIVSDTLLKFASRPLPSFPARTTRFLETCGTEAAFGGTHRVRASPPAGAGSAALGILAVNHRQQGHQNHKECQR